MKLIHPISLTKAGKALSAVLLFASFCLQSFGQGSLTPPEGIPGPVMRTLTQIEPRIPVEPGSPGVDVDANGGVVISQNGSYYLTGNLTYSGGAAGIQIQAQRVTLDLSGFSLAIVAAQGQYGIAAAPGIGGFVHIRNGGIHSSSSWGALDSGGFGPAGWICGIFVYSGSVLIEDVTINGMQEAGIFTLSDASGSIERVNVTNSASGIITQAGMVVRNSTVTRCGSASDKYGISSQTVSGCSVNVVSGFGISAISVDNCVAVSNYNSAIIAQFGSISNSFGSSQVGAGIFGVNVMNSRGTSNSGFGVYSTGMAMNSWGESNSTYGLVASNATNCGGITTSGTIGLYCTGTANNCYGSSPVLGGIAIYATVAIGCSKGSGTVSVPAGGSKWLGTP